LRDGGEKGETYTCQTTIAKIDGKCVQEEAPSLGITQGKPCLAPDEYTCLVRAGLALHNALMGDFAFGLVEEDGFVRAVGEEDQSDEAQGTSDGTEEEEQELPAVDCADSDVSDTICDDTTDEVGDAVAEEPRGLSARLVHQSNCSVICPGY
jgi:hypothetical protein